MPMRRNPGTFASIAGTAQLFSTATAPQYLYGATVQTALIALGSLSSLVTATASASTLSITANWQASDDATNWYDVVPVNNAANVALITGTGTSASVSKVVNGPDVYGWKYARVKCTSSGANASGADGVTVSYRYSKA